MLHITPKLSVNRKRLMMVQCTFNSRWSNRIIIEIQIFPVKAGGRITRHFAANEFLVKRTDHPPFDLMATVNVDRMGNIRVKFDTRMTFALMRPHMAILVEPTPAIIAIAGA